MFAAPSPALNPVLETLERRAQAKGAKLLPSGVYGVGGFRVLLERRAPTGPLAPPTLSNHRVIPLGGGVFSEVGRRFGPLSTVSALRVLLEGRVYGAKAQGDQQGFLIDPGPPISKLHIPGVQAVQELPELRLWQWLELMARVQLFPYEGQPVYEKPSALARALGARPQRAGLASEWVGILRLQHVGLLARVGTERLQRLDPQPPLLEGQGTG